MFLGTVASLVQVSLESCHVALIDGSTMKQPLNWFMELKPTYHVHEVRQLLRKPAAHDVNHQAESLHTQTADFLALNKI